jgi:hypothetical protein
VDDHGRIFAVLAGKPLDPTYDEAATGVLDMILQAQKTANFNPRLIKHRRGHFPALLFGISHGNGQPSPKCLKVGKHAALVDSLLRSSDLVRLASYADGEPFPQAAASALKRALLCT